MTFRLGDFGWLRIALMGLGFVAGISFGNDLEAEYGEGEFPSHVYRLHALGSEGVFLDFARDLKAQNSYSIEAFFSARFNVKVRRHPEKLISLEQIIGLDFPSKMAIVWLPRSEMRQMGSRSIAGDLRFGSQLLSTKLIPMIVKPQNSNTEQLLIFDPHGEAVFAFANLSDDIQRESVFQKVKSGRITDGELKVLSATANSIVERPRPERVQEIYFEQSQAAYKDRLQNESQALKVVNQLIAKLRDDVVDERSMKQLLEILEKHFPVNYEYLSRSDLVGFSERYRLDFSIMRQINMANFFKFAKLAESRWLTLLDGLDRFDELGAVSADRLWALVFGAEFHSKLVPFAFEFLHAKWKAGKISDAEFRSRVQYLIKNKDFDTDLMLAEVLHADVLDESFEDSARFVRALADGAQNPTADNIGRPRVMSDGQKGRCQALLKRIEF